MLTWSHYRFQQHLKHKIREYPWCRLVMVSEAYTCHHTMQSKTCSECGHIKADLGGNKIYCCDVCPNTSDRDWNGARGILVRFLTEWTRVEDDATETTVVVIDLTGDD